MRVSRMNSKIQRTSLQSEIIRYIQNYIQENGLKPGDRLPSQEKLIEMMGVSRTSLREAMKTLEARNVLEAKNGKGIYVGSQEVNDLLRLIDFAKEKELLLDTLEVRKILEGDTAHGDPLRSPGGVRRTGSHNKGADGKVPPGRAADSRG